MNGILYGIGVGPGAPDLISLRAARILAQADLILAPASPKNEQSLALEIARPHLNAQARILRLDFPMTRNVAILEAAWHKAGQITAQALESGAKAVFPTLGDPLIYSTFAYLQKAVRAIAPAAKIEIIPGITSFQAAAARAGVSLCEGEEPFTLVSGILPEQELLTLLQRPGGAAILKVYRNYQAIAAALKASGRADDCIVASFVERTGEEIRRGAPQEKPPYMTLVLAPGGKN